jgi:hypothetical protein
MDILNPSPFLHCILNIPFAGNSFWYHAKDFWGKILHALPMQPAVLPKKGGGPISNLGADRPGEEHT